jgi:hypothetical protein
MQDGQVLAVEDAVFLLFFLGCFFGGLNSMNCLLSVASPVQPISRCLVARGAPTDQAPTALWHAPQYQPTQRLAVA